MFSSIGSLAIRLRFAVLAAGLAVVVVGLGYGTGVTGDLVSGGFDVPGSDSAEVESDVVDRLDQEHLLRGLAHRALDLDVARVPDHHDLVAVTDESLHLVVHLRDEWAGGVDGEQVGSRRGHGATEPCPSPRPQ